MTSCVTAAGVVVLAIMGAGYFGMYQMLPPPKPKVIGIDLGTTYSCVGAFQPGSGEVLVFVNELNQSCIPSVISFRNWPNEPPVVGQKAVERLQTEPLTTIYDAKRFIGKVFTKETFAAEAAHYSFPIELNPHDGGAVFVMENGDRLRPENVSAFVLRQLKATALSKIGMYGLTRSSLDQPQLTVISVPAEFNDNQRAATERAAAGANLDVLRLISEPTAAAMAYGLHKRAQIDFVLVLDLGGGTLDVSLLNIQNGVFLTVAMAGNARLGGQDFSQRVYQHVSHVCNETLRLGDSRADLIDQLMENTSYHQYLRMLSENVKIQLSNSTAVQFDCLPSDKDYFPSVPSVSGQLSRVEFESICHELFEKVLEPVRIVLDEASLDVDDVDEVVLVGGSSRLPRVRQMVKNHFNGRPPNCHVDPDEAVVRGVAVQAGILGGAWPLTVTAVERPTSVEKIRLS